ncbi:MAG: hypothetical protein J7K47_04370 [Thermoplasmata archaeon]|nr:hypothetical protein [Thermoplasmata archaeon]
MLEKLGEKDIEKLFDPVIRQRGYEYFEDEAVVNPVAFENKIMATVVGTANYITSIEVKNNELHFSCTCPYEGRCKHEAALLYAWIKRRDDFLNIEEILNNLRKMDKEEIISVIEDAIRVNPANFVFLAPFDEKAMKRKIDNLFEFEYPYSGESFLASELKNLLPRIKKNKECAVSILEYIILKMIDYDVVEYEGFEEIMDLYLQALKEAIKGKVDEKIVEKYFNYYIERDDFTGIFLSILMDICDVDKLKFLEKLAKEKEDNEEAMEILVKIYENLGEKEKYVDAATKLIRHQYSQHENFDESIIEKLIEMGETGKVIELLNKFKTRQALHYLMLAYEKEGNIDEAFRISKQLLQQNIYPSLISKVRKYAKKKGEWEEIKKEIIKALKNDGRYDEIVKLALEEEDVETMVAYLHRCRDAHLLEKVSKFIDERNDMVALKRLVEIFIDKGGRENYKIAVNYLMKLKEKWTKNGRMEEWLSYLDYIKKRYRKKYGLILEIEKRI